MRGTREPEDYPPTSGGDTESSAEVEDVPPRFAACASMPKMSTTQSSENRTKAKGGGRPQTGADANHLDQAAIQPKIQPTPPNSKSPPTFL